MPALRLLALAALVLPLAAMADDAPAPGDADIALDNHWGIPFDLHVDRQFGCSAPKDGTFTACVELQARDGDDVVARRFVTLKPGENFSYHVEKGKGPNL